MTTKKKKSWVAEIQEPLSVFEWVQMASDRKKMEDKEARFAAMSPAERHEHRGGAMAAGMLFRCLGERSEDFHGDGLLDRLHSEMMRVCNRTESWELPRPFRFQGDELQRFELNDKKRCKYMIRRVPDVVFEPSRCTVGFEAAFRRPMLEFSPAKGTSYFRLVLVVGLVSDLIFSPVVGEYVYSQPEWQGRHWVAESEALPLDAAATVALEVVLPFEGGLPAGLRPVAFLGVEFLRKGYGGGEPYRIGNFGMMGVGVRG
jgi:hypothetical protein